jgi:hypothetical protein
MEHPNRRLAEGHRIVAFYEGGASDDRGRSLETILQFDDEQLEDVHDFIQWLFPLPERSGANPAAPTLDDNAIDTFRARPELRAALRRSLDRMLAFYGFERGRSDWLTPGNHNYLRLTRILRSLRVLGEPQAAQALFETLAGIYNDDRRSGRNRISDRTFAFWKSAVEDEEI